MSQPVHAADARRVGLLGGSFDPIHCTHLDLAQSARCALALDEVQLLPAAQPWQRGALGASADQRLAMLALAIQGRDGLTINDGEIRRGGPTYTVQTLRELKAGEDPGQTLFWLMGSDQLRNFDTWRDWQEIAARVQLAVAERPGHPPEAPAALKQWLDAHGRSVLHVPFAPRNASATDIRERLRRGQPIDGLTPPAVADYIRTHHLYRT
ncbi:nicotinate (nicotinamide) nucleotide adenylyltransferase [Verticiella sediminum]|uniref:nicotinate (nicotinamide) nucleotide adenylyltransferase n=1 Tax=Verticiella sediminum TaxID=1247510 RepID=UPI001FE522C0|nr:nicotinate (nicotinamide) nucleotide adenylyltransferase [Verticiella sediminum]